MPNRPKYFRNLLFGVVIGVFVIFVYLFVGISSSEPGSFYNSGHNAIWLEHEWVGEKKSEAEIQQLVNKLKFNQIDTVFVHSGPFEYNGKIPGSVYPYATYFLQTARKFDPTIQYQAWLGQRRSFLDLDEEEYRKNVSKEALLMTKIVGFDGIHFDIEPVWDGDEGFIKLLSEVRGAIGEEKKISVALAEFIPESIVWITQKSHNLRNYNTEVNYLNVAQYADQLVAMVYDTGIDSPWMYRFLLREETIWLSQLLDGKELFIGLPSYDEGVGFNPVAENLENGLLGVTSGLNNIRSEEENFAGVAIYAYWEMDEGEWDAMQRLWFNESL